ncbi:MAG: hypothetical protein QT10_C0001G0076 [archaeon GW2011_AR19]|nr:MAG: hypothetical protein QT10_C0001G0076 [archaeon GW2011_AR19]
MAREKEIKQSALIIIAALAGAFLSFFFSKFMTYNFPLNLISIMIYTIFVLFVVKWFIKAYV